MHLFGICVFEQQEETARQSGRQARTGRQPAARDSGGHADIDGGSAFRICPASTGCGSKAPDKAASELPSAPAPVLHGTRESASLVRAGFFKARGPVCWAIQSTCTGPPASPRPALHNSVRLTDLVKDGKIYLSLSDALALALENNYDIAIARYDLDIADTDILRTRTGAAPLGGAIRAVVTGTLGGSTSTLTIGRRSRRHHGRFRRRRFRQFRPGAVHTGAGPAPENLDPS